MMEIPKIKIDSMVRLKINNDNWIGQVKEIRNDIVLVQLLDNMHYHANMTELKLLSDDAKEETYV